MTTGSPPGIAVVGHHAPHQLFAMLVCQSVTAKLNRLQLLAYQQAASDVQAASVCRPTVSNQHAQAPSLHHQMLRTCWQSTSQL